MTWRRAEGHRTLEDAERAERNSILVAAGRLIQSTESTFIKFVTLSLIEGVVFSRAQVMGRPMGVAGLPAFVEMARQVGHLGAASSLGLYQMSKKASVPGTTDIQGITRFIDDCSHLGRLVSTAAASRGSDDSGLPPEFSIGQNTFSVIAQNRVSWDSLLLATASIDITPTFDAFGRTLLHIIMELLITTAYHLRGEVNEDKMGYISIGQDAVAPIERIIGVVGIDSQDFRGRTALHIACAHGQVQVARFLLEKGAKPDLRDQNGRTPIDSALRRGELELVVELCRKAPPERRACFLVDSSNDSGKAPLLAAYDMADISVIKSMHEIWSAHLTANDACLEEGLGFLHLAAKKGDISKLRQLLDIDLRPFDCLSRSGRTPLSLAAEHGYIGVVAMLLRYTEVDPDARDNSGRTPLSFAAENGHHSIVNILLLRSCGTHTRCVYPEGKDYAGRTPLDYATAKSHQRVMDLLRNKNAVGDLIEVSQAGHGKPWHHGEPDAAVISDLRKVMGPPPPAEFAEIRPVLNYSDLVVKAPEGGKKRKYAGSIMSKSSKTTQSTNSQRLHFEIEWPDTGSIKSHSSIGRDYRCCDEQFSTLHDLLTHEEEYHRAKGEGEYGANGTGTRKLAVVKFSAEERILEEEIIAGVGGFA